MKSLFRSTGAFYKANLHGHTTVSDGENTPAEIKAIYKAKGYQIIAYTDHDVIVDQSALNDDDFLTLTSCEYEFNDPAKAHLPYSFMPTYHFCLYSPTPAQQYYPYANPDYSWGNAREIARTQPYYKGSSVHEFKTEYVNAMIEDAHAHGFLVSYNHPEWSLNSFPDYAGIEGVDFVECGNSGCYTDGYLNDFSDAVFRDFLRLGKRCFPTATDDGHDSRHYCLAWTMIRADSLSYEDVFASLRAGDLYASWGPSILDLRFDPETMLLEADCSEVQQIALVTERRFTACKTAAKEPLTSAVFDLAPYLRETFAYGDPGKAFVRLILVDAAGRKALSRAYFADELIAR